MKHAVKRLGSLSNTNCGTVYNISCKRVEYKKYPMSDV